MPALAYRCSRSGLADGFVALVTAGRSVLELEDDQQPGVLFIVNGVLSTVSDNVFVATVFIKGVAE